MPGETLKLKHTVIQRNPAEVVVKWLGIRYGADNQRISVDRMLSINQNETVNATRTLPADTALTHPYWLELPSTAGMAQVADKSLVGQPENEPAYVMTYEFALGDQTLALLVAPVQVTRDPVRGELRDTLQVIPPVSVGFADQLARFAPGETREVKVNVIAARADLSGTLELALPTGWKAAPAAQEFMLASIGERVEATFAVTAPVRAESVSLGVHATVGGRSFNRSPEVIAYDHIPVQLLQPPSKLTAMSLDLKIRGQRVGFLPGAGDTTVETLTLMGYEVKVLSESDLSPTGLAGLDAVVLGIRAYNTRPDLMNYRSALWDFVKAGGNVVVQYNTTSQLPKGDLGPYPLRISRDRVTDENAKVTLLAPNHPALLGPNRITATDFEGWVQERGLYFPDQWDSAYTPLLGMADPDEGQTRGSLLVAKLGEGYFVYTGLSLFRELPAGVPGAYRLFANLISLE